MSSEEGKEQVECRCCENGRWWTECCNGSGGCSCQGGPIDMGECLVCKGTGFHDPETPTDQNWRSIAGLCFIGSGPETGMWASPEVKKGNLK